MNKLRHYAGALIIFATLTLLMGGIFTSFKDGYDITETDLQTYDGNNGNIIDQFNNMLLMESIAEIEDSILTLNSGSLIDILGGLAAAGIGVIKAILGLLIFPYSFVNIILTYYGGAVTGAIGGLASLIGTYAAFILLSAYLRSDV